MMEHKGIVIHCADTFPAMDTTAEDIDGWHKARGWDGIGYHFVICRNGTIQQGRLLGTKGAHARGKNSWVGICVVGGKAHPGKQIFNFTHNQIESLYIKVRQVQKQFNISNSNVIGHNEVSDKACPAFDVRAWIGD